MLAALAASVISRAGDWDRAARLASEVEALARTITSPYDQAEALAGLSAAAANAGDRDRAVQLADIIGGLTLTPRVGIPWDTMLSLAISQPADVYWAEAFARTTAQPGTQANVLVHLAVLTCQAGDLDRAEAIVGAITMPERQAWALARLAGIAGDAGDRDRAVRLADDAEALGRSITEPRDQAGVLAELAAAISKAGDLDRAEAIARAITKPSTRAEAFTELAVTAAQAGKLDHARKLLALALTAGASNPGRLIKGVSRIFPSIIKDVEDVLLNAYQADALRALYTDDKTH